MLLTPYITTVAGTRLVEIALVKYDLFQSSIEKSIPLQPIEFDDIEIIYQNASTFHPLPDWDTVADRLQRELEYATK